MTLYRVKLSYCLNIEAGSISEATKKACEQIKSAPNLIISNVEDARYSNHRPTWKRLLTGR